MSADLVEGFAVVANHEYHPPLREGARCLAGHDGGLDVVGMGARG